MFENDFMVEFNDEELGECRTYPRNFKGYEQAIKDLKLYKAKQNQRIAELEEQLKKKPKYNIGDRVYIINEDYEVERDFIESIDIDTDGIEYYTETYSICWYENQLFATKAEAQAKLEELGEKND